VLRHCLTTISIELIRDIREAKRFFRYKNFQLDVFLNPRAIIGEEALVHLQDVKLAMKKFHDVDIEWIESHLIGVR
jgi:hypothetical protein